MNLHSASDGSVASQVRFHRDIKLLQRIAVALLLFPFVGWVIADGEWLFLLVIACILSIAVAEYGRLYRHHGFRPALPLLVVGVFTLTVSRYFFGFTHSPLILAGICLVGQVWHMVDYERGAPNSATDFAVTLGGVLFLGWIGSYLVSLRRLPDGVWWMLIALPSIWLADSLAYVAGRAFGRHKLTRRLSPKKSWEGYLAGWITGTLSGVGLAALWRIGAGPTSSLTLVRGMVVGSTIGLLAPLGDLGISMIKREIRVKDTSTALPGHGGILDRLDSWLWAGALGYYIVSWFLSYPG